MLADRVQRSGHRIRRDGNAAREGFQLDDAKSIGPAREDEDIRRSHGPNQLGIVQFTEEMDVRIGATKRSRARTGADHDFRARKIEIQECLDILFHGQARCRQEDRPREVQTPGGRRRKQVRVNTARPESKI